MAGIVGNDWKRLEWLKVTGNDLKWLDIDADGAGMAGMAGNCLKKSGMAGIGLKVLEIA